MATSQGMCVLRCEFFGTVEELQQHLEKECKYDCLKEFIARTEGRMTELATALQQRDQDVSFLRAMLGNLSQKVEKMEQDFDKRLGEGAEDGVGEVAGRGDNSGLWLVG